MIKTLYKTFQHWSEKGSVYLLSDPHFGDLDMNWRWSLIKDYPYVVLDEVSENSIAQHISHYLIYQINKLCTKNDTLILLGDIGDVSWVSSIKAGYKVLITGNHDKGNSYYESLFDEVYNGPIFISKSIVLSHEPMPLGPYFNIHGHEHFDHSDEWIDCLAGIKFSDYYLNACCEHNAFIPMNLDKIIKDKALGSFIDIHRVTINEATKRKKNN